MSDDEASEEVTNRPSKSAFHQQRMPAWQPLLTAGTAFPLFLIASIAFLVTGSFLLSANDSVQEVEFDYTHCLCESDGRPCWQLTESAEFQAKYGRCLCKVEFNLTRPIVGQVYAYYGLTGFFQNHRKYVKSRDVQQLAGVHNADLSDSCDPYRRREGLWVSPCGAVAASVFNDTFKLALRNATGPDIPVPWTGVGIAWDSDRSRKFGVVSNWNGTIRPIGWQLPERGRSRRPFADDEELQVWMRVAALPRFRKLHKIVQHRAGLFKSGLPAGRYSLLVNYSFPVTAFGGSKRFVLATAGWLGARNVGLGILTLTVGLVQFLLSVGFAGLHYWAKRKREQDQFWGMDTRHRALLEHIYQSGNWTDNTSDDDGALD